MVGVPRRALQGKNMTSGSNKTFSIRKAVDEDLDIVKKIADAHRNELGFVLRPSLEGSIRNDEMLIAELSNQLVGFVDYHRRKDRRITLYHIAVLDDNQRLGVGRALVKALCDEAKKAGSEFISLKCPTDLAANLFYKAYGFTLTETLNGRKRPLNVWRLSL